MMRLEALIREGNRASLADAVELYKESCGSGRLMREHDLSPKQRRRYVATTDSDHDEPIFPNLAADMAPDGPNQLWVAAPTSPLRPASSTSPRSWMPGRAGLSDTRSAAR